MGVGAVQVEISSPTKHRYFVSHMWAKEKHTSFTTVKDAVCMAHPICKAITTDIIYYAQRRLKLLNFGALIVNSSLSFSLHVLTFLYMTQYHSKKLLACWEFLPNLNIKMAEEKLHFFFCGGKPRSSSGTVSFFQRCDIAIGTGCHRW